MTVEPITAVVFDKDGTLFDFRATWGHFTARLIDHLAQGERALGARLERALGFHVATETFAPDSIVIAGTAAEMAGAAARVLPDRTVAGLVAEIDRMAAEAPQMPVLPLGPYLDDLSARGLALGVATNDSEMPARAHLEAAGIAARFDFIAGYDSGHGAKPGPGPLLAFAEAVGRAPGACAMVGDSLHDLMAARAAGMRAVAVLTGIAGADVLSPVADVVLPDIGALAGWLETL